MFFSGVVRDPTYGEDVSPLYFVSTGKSSQWCLNSALVWLGWGIFVDPVEVIRCRILPRDPRIYSRVSSF